MELFEPEVCYFSPDAIPSELFKVNVAILCSTA